MLWAGRDGSDIPDLVRNRNRQWDVGCGIWDMGYGYHPAHCQPPFHLLFGWHFYRLSHTYIYEFSLFYVDNIFNEVPFAWDFYLPAQSVKLK